MLFKEFGGVDAFPICLATKDVDEIVATVKAIAPVFGGINLEDISAPRCFEIERRLRDELDIPVFHDDQHGTAVVVLAALHNALEVVGKRLEDVRIVLTGCRRRRQRGDEHAARRRRDRRRRLRPRRCALRRQAGHVGGAGRLRRAGRTRPACSGTADEALAGADVFIGVSAPGAVSVEGVALDGAGRDRVRDGEPVAGGHARGDRRPRRRRSARAAPTTRTRSTTCSPSRASSGARSTCGPPRSPRR